MIQVSVIEYSASPRPAAVEVEPPDALLLHAESARLSNSTIFYVPVPRWVSPGQIDTLINLLDEQHRVAADLVVLRLHPQFVSKFKASDAGQDLVARFPDTPVLLLGWDGEYGLEQLGGTAIKDLDGLCLGLLPVLRQAETRILLDRSGVVLPADDTFHYEGPNGRHYESFVRVGTAIQSIDTLDGLAFWLLPGLMKCSVIVLDSWTIMSLGLHASRYAAQIEGSALAHMAVECRQRYDEPSEQLQSRLVGLANETENPSALVVMSVSSTGASKEGLVKTCRDSGFLTVKDVSVFAGTDQSGEAFCVIDDVATHWAESQCPRCEVGSSRVRVMRDTYLLDLAATVRKDIAIRVNQIRQGTRFFERYAGLGAISVHRNQEDDERHHMIHVNVGALLRSKAFLDQLDAELAEVQEVDLVLCPDHIDGCGLARLVAEKLQIPWIAANPERLLDITGEDDQRLREARRVLVVDDIVMTGTRLRRYRNALHRRGIADDFQLHFLAGVARPESIRALKGISDYTHDPDRFHHVELLLLPNWGVEECPWCLEKDLLRRYGSQVVDDTAALAERQRRLADVTGGLSDALFLEWLAGSPPPTSPWQLGPDSVFRAQTEPELFASICNALQVLRSDELLNERFTLPVAKNLDRHLTISGRFYDSAITACLLRATRRHDLRSTATDPALEKEVNERLKDAPHVALHGELLFALARRHLPGRGLPVIQEVLQDPAGEAGLRQLFGVALSSN